MERRTPSGLVVEERSDFTASEGVVPNDNVLAAHPPGTVGPLGPVPGDPNGLLLLGEGTSAPWPGSTFTASPWSGWPAEWDTPSLYGHAALLTDTAWSCLDLNSNVLSTMPPYLVGASDSLPADWLNNPNPDLYTSWEEFAKQLFWDFQMGEAFVLATARYANGYPARFHVVDPWFVNVDMVDGRRAYSVGEVDVTDDLLHIRYTSRTSDAHGHGPLEAGAGRLVAGRALAQYASGLASSGGIPNSVLKHPGNLNKTQAEDLQTRWVAARMNSLGLPAVLSGGVEFEVIQMDPTRMGLVELSQWTESRICVLLGVPPFLMGLPSGGDSMTYTNVQSLFDYHWRAGLRPKASHVMAALSGWLLPRGTTVELNRDEYIRPGPLERAQTAEILIRNGITTPDEVREKERFGPPIGGVPVQPEGVLQ